MGARRKTIAATSLFMKDVLLSPTSLFLDGLMRRVATTTADNYKRPALTQDPWIMDVSPWWEMTSLASLYLTSFTDVLPS